MELKVKEADVTDPGLEKDTYDAVRLFNVLRYFENSAVETTSAILINVGRSLKNGGTLFAGRGSDNDYQYAVWQRVDNQLIRVSTDDPRANYLPSQGNLSLADSAP